MAKQPRESGKKTTKSSAQTKPSAAKAAGKASWGESKTKTERKPQAKVVLSQAERKVLVARLLAMREELTGQIAALKNDALKRNDEVNPVEDGTDAYDRQFGLSLASSEQEAVAQMNDALRRLADGTYGVCEQCQGGIEKARIEALPFVRTCIRCQSDMEKNNSKYRPSAGTLDTEQWDENRTPSHEGEEEET